MKKKSGFILVFRIKKTDGIPYLVDGEAEQIKRKIEQLLGGHWIVELP